MDSVNPLSLSQESIEFSSENPVSIFGSQATMQRDNNQNTSTFKQSPTDETQNINTS